jgi:hypothetical protein
MGTKTGAYSADKFSAKQLGQDKNALGDFPEAPPPEKPTPVTPSSKWQVGKDTGPKKKVKWS